MESEPRIVPIEELLAHAEWLRRLARSLAADDGTADGLVQETWLAAVQRPPRTGGRSRAWLATVLRNFARQRGRERRVRDEIDSRWIILGTLQQ